MHTKTVARCIDTWKTDERFTVIRGKFENCVGNNKWSKFKITNGLFEKIDIKEINYLILNVSNNGHVTINIDRNDDVILDNYYTSPIYELGMFSRRTTQYITDIFDNRPNDNNENGTKSTNDNFPNTNMDPNTPTIEKTSDERPCKTLGPLPLHLDNDNPITPTNSRRPSTTSKLRDILEKNSNTKTPIHKRPFDGN